MISYHSINIFVFIQSPFLCSGSEIGIDRFLSNHFKPGGRNPFFRFKNKMQFSVVTAPALAVIEIPD